MVSNFISEIFKITKNVMHFLIKSSESFIHSEKCIEFLNILSYDSIILIKSCNTLRQHLTESTSALYPSLYSDYLILILHKQKFRRKRQDKIQQQQSKNGLGNNIAADSVYHLGCKLLHSLCVHRCLRPFVPEEAQNLRHHLNLW